jgi:UDP-N-acetylmuramoyl-tripeptide--D-alanyl-D-alanine ligase
VLWSADDAVRATGGRATQPWVASGVSIDSRTLEAGDLFVALKGEIHDGHDHLDQVAERGASAALVSRAVTGAGASLPLLIVPDTFEGLRALARAARERTKARLVAVTGSVGKTGTKELLARIFEAHGPTAASAGNLNNHIGAPLSLARMWANCTYGVFELGMNHAGEIAPLTRLVRPHVALITTVQAVHLEFFSGVEAIADAKAEIFEGLEPGGVALINRDDATFDRLHAAARRLGVTRIIGFGAHADAEARLLAWRPDDEGGTVEAVIAGRVLRYRLNLAGKHWALNSVAALAAANAAGADLARGAAALAALTPLKGRGARHRISLKGGTAELIDESYNASPAAMKAALETLASRSVATGARRVAVLGDMRELGPEGPRFHAELASTIERANIDLVLLAGPLMAHLDAALPARRRGGHAPISQALLPLVRAALKPGDVVLIKGSLGSRMSVIVADLLKGTEAGRAL